MNTGILLLAAGFGRRFGSDKRYAPLPGGERLLVASARAAMNSGLPLRVCLREGEHDFAATLRDAGAGIIFCADAAAGMGATLAEGVAHCEDWDGVLVALGDMPFVLPDTYRQVAQALETAPLCRPTFAGEPGHPVAFSSSLFGELCRLRGDEGARSVVQRHRIQLCELALDDPGILRDVDTPGDVD